MRNPLVFNEKKKKFFLCVCGGKTGKNQFSTFFVAQPTGHQHLREIFFVKKL